MTLRAVIETAPPPVLVRGDVVAAFNAGGPALTEGGIDFAAALSGTDGTPFSGGAQFTDNAGGNGLQPVFNGTVYQTEINDGGNDATPGLFSFSSAVGIEPDKLYYIDLYFAEIFASAVGQREFSVFVEGQEVLTDYDILANNNGGDINAPVVVQLATPVSPGANGAIDLSFTATADRAKISAIVIREAVAPLPDGVIGIADAPTLAETGDTGSTTLLFPLTITGPDAIATLTFTVNGVEQSAEVSFVDGAGVLGVDVPNDDVDTGDTGVTVVLTDAPGFTIGTATATGTVTDDDAVIVDPTDIDGDGFPNTLDPSAYDDTNGAANTLAKGGRIEFNFDTQTTDVFDASTGLTGVMVNLAGLNVNAAPGDVYGTLTNEATSLINGEGFLQVASSSQDSFSTGTGANNAQKDAYQAMFDVSGNDTIRFETRVKNPFDTEPASFLSLGLQIGAGDMDSFVKFVFGGNNGSGTNGATRIQIGHNTSLVGGETNTNTLASMFDAAALTAAGYADYNALLADIETVVLAIEVDRSGATKTLKGLWTFENVAETEIFSGETIVRTIISGSKLDLALDGLNPNTGNTGGVAFGVIHTDWNSGTQTANDTFTAEFDYLHVVSLDEVPNSPPTVLAEIADQTPVEDALYSFAIPAGTFADDAGAAALVLTATLADDTPLPSWLSFDPATGTFSGTPLQADVDAGAITVKVTATDAQEESVSDEFTLTPQNVNDAPTITGTLAPVETTLGAATTVDLSGLTLADEDGDHADAGRAVPGGTPLPAGITLDGTSLEVADDTAEGVYTIDVFANDTQLNSDTPVSVTVTVGAPLNDAPTVATEIADQTPDEDALYSFAIPAGTFADDAGEGALVLTATLADDTPLPAWLSFDPATGTFSGTPLQADVDAGAITVKVTATDAQEESVSDEFTLTPQNVNDAPTITGTLAPVETTFGAATTVDLSALTLADEDGDTPTLVALSQGGLRFPPGSRWSARRSRSPTPPPRASTPSTSSPTTRR